MLINQFILAATPDPNFSMQATYVSNALLKASFRGSSITLSLLRDFMSLKKRYMESAPYKGKDRLTISKSARAECRLTLWPFF